MSNHTPPTPLFLTSGNARLLVLVFQPEIPGEQAILLAPPFGDEMNKSRRMQYLQAQYFSQHGYTVLMVDLFGTGDSSGEFSEATWETWRENLYDAWNWLKQEKGITQIHFWGIRLGCLLALDTASHFKLSVESFLFWQPIVKGDRFVTQLMRLKLAEQFGRNSSESVRTLRERSTSREMLEIGGYSLSKELLAALSSLDASELSPAPGTPIAWLECSTASTTSLLPSSLKVIEKWRQNNNIVKASFVSGPSFWNSVETEVVPQLIEQTGLLFAESNNHVRE